MKNILLFGSTYRKTRTFIREIIDDDHFLEQMGGRTIENRPDRAQERRTRLVVKNDDHRCVGQIRMELHLLASERREVMTTNAACALCVLLGISTVGETSSQRDHIAGVLIERVVLPAVVVFDSFLGREFVFVDAHWIAHFTGAVLLGDVLLCVVAGRGHLHLCVHLSGLFASFDTLLGRMILIEILLEWQRIDQTIDERLRSIPSVSHSDQQIWTGARLRDRLGAQRKNDDRRKPERRNQEEILE